MALDAAYCTNAAVYHHQLQRKDHILAVVTIVVAAVIAVVAVASSWAEARIRLPLGCTEEARHAATDCPRVLCTVEVYLAE